MLVGLGVRCQHLGIESRLNKQATPKHGVCVQRLHDRLEHGTGVGADDSGSPPSAGGADADGDVFYVVSGVWCHASQYPTCAVAERHWRLVRRLQCQISSGIGMDSSSGGSKGLVAGIVFDINQHCSMHRLRLCKQ